MVMVSSFLECNIVGGGSGGGRGYDVFVRGVAMCMETSNAFEFDCVDLQWLFVGCSRIGL